MWTGAAIPQNVEEESGPTPHDVENQINPGLRHR